MAEERRGRRIWRGATLAAGVALLVAAAVYAAWGIDWTVLRQADPWQAAALAGLVALNLALTGLLFWSITRSFDAVPPVGPGRMVALICASALLNYLPLLRPGLVGRAAYLKVKHNLPVRQSVLILAVVLALAVVVLPVSALVLVAVPANTAGVRWWALVVSWVVLSAATGPVARQLLRRQVAQPWQWVPLRAADMLVSAARLWLAFNIVGAPIGYAEAVVAGAASLLVRIVGLTPNGLGLSEWVVAVITPLVAPVSTAAGAAAALVDRVVELLVVLVAGAVGTVGLRK